MRAAACLARRYGVRIGIGLAVLAGIVAILWPAERHALVLYNDSASVPLGFWLRSEAAITKGSVIAFRPPAPAMPYVSAHMSEYVHHDLILKYVVAVAGDTICRTAANVFTVNGDALGVAAMRDERGVILPHWQGCRRLGPGEVAVFSNHIPNSFDSRYYGAVPAQDIRGVYRPLWTW